MVASEAMQEVLERFAERFNASSDLARMTRGWDRTLRIAAQDAGWVHGLRVDGGRAAWVTAPEPSQAEIALQANADTLAAIFRGELSPTEPYLDGSLLVRSSEEDMMKLDVFTLMVWGE